jgi:hypothetical protein
MSDEPTDSGPKLNTGAKAHIIGIRDIHFMVDEYDAKRLIQTLGGFRDIDINNVMVVESRGNTQIGVHLAGLPPTWSPADRDAMGQEIIVGLRMMGRQPWVDYVTAAEFARVGTHIEHVRQEAPDNAIVMDLSDRFQIAPKATSPEVLRARVNEMVEATKKLAGSEFSKGVQANLAAGAISSAATATAMKLLPMLMALVERLQHIHL